jgi:pimeloyl-ACP methyl ester carboxylesterase
MNLLDSIISDGNTIVLPDGRKLGYSDWGPVDGEVVLFFPGIPCSRFFRFGSEKLLLELNVRLLVLERPCYGISDPKQNRKIVDLAEDAKNFLDILNIENAHLIGYSAGGPFALSCAYFIPHKIKNVALVSACDPHFENEVYINHSSKIKRYINLVRYSPNKALATAQELAINPKKITEELVGAASERDQEIFSQPEINSMFLANFIEGTFEGTNGFEYANELFMLFQPWNFPYQKIEKEIGLWYGKKDRNEFHSPTFGKYLSEKLLLSNHHLYDDEGASILWTKSKEILISLLNPS